MHGFGRARQAHDRAQRGKGEYMTYDLGREQAEDVESLAAKALMAAGLGVRGFALAGRWLEHGRHGRAADSLVLGSPAHASFVLEQSGQKK